jgi:hypothetical protein
MADYAVNKTKPEAVENSPLEAGPQELATAIIFVASCLAYGPRDVKEIDIDAAARDINTLALRRAKEALKIESVHDAHNDRWMWLFPGLKKWQPLSRKPDPYRKLRLLLKAWLSSNAEDRENFREITELENAEQAITAYLNEARLEAQSQDGGG